MEGILQFPRIGRNESSPSSSRSQRYFHTGHDLDFWTCRPCKAPHPPPRWGSDPFILATSGQYETICRVLLETGVIRESESTFSSPIIVDTYHKKTENVRRVMLETGVIRESESTFSSPIMSRTYQEHRTLQLCIDYRKLNLDTVKDNYALQSHSRHLPVRAGSAFSTSNPGITKLRWQKLTNSTGLLGDQSDAARCNAPSTFQRLMERCMGDLHLKEVLVFLDDLIIFSDTLEEHESRLVRVLHRLKDYGLKLLPEKCKFFQASVRYLGHIVSEQIRENKCLEVRSLRSFLGFAGYYRRFIKGYAAIAKPLNDLTKGYAPGHFRGRKRNIHFKPRCQTAF